jgi:pyruvate dehydrogenase E2 component (dihydrolipoamide acetyltransferase)
MPINILMPALSPTMEKGNLAKWLKKEGDKVKTGDILAEIETDKATMEYEAVDDGTLAKILVPEGSADIAVNQPIAILATEGEDVKAAAAGAPAKTAAPPAQPAKAVPASPAAAAAPIPGPAPSAPAPAASGANPPATKAPAPAPATNGHAGRIFASPLARRLAKASGIEIGRIAGTGPHGRIIARDVEAAKSGGATLRVPVAAPSAAAPAPVLAPSDDKIRALFEPGSYEVVPHDNMRKIIAQRLVQAKQTIPHFYLTVNCTIDKLLAAREDINVTAPKGADGKPAWKLSVNDFVIKAMAMALIRVPDANVTWTETGMLKHKSADIGVAVAIPGGLITPVIRKAEMKSLTTISREMKDYAARARARRLKPEEYQGGSTAISNLGMYGIEEFAAVINPPHATILAVGTGEQRPVVRDGKIVIATEMTVTLSTDHRAVDGAVGAELLGAFRTLIESPMLMLA